MFTAGRCSQPYTRTVVEPSRRHSRQIALLLVWLVKRSIGYMPQVLVHFYPYSDWYGLLPYSVVDRLCMHPGFRNFMRRWGGLIEGSLLAD